MKTKNNSPYINKNKLEILNISQLSIQQLNQVLVDNPSFINTTDSNGETPLSYALKKK